jgi:hypothetical protein
MFTGFASENTPAIQVWEFFRPFASTGATRDVMLSDDCAPIQFFKTGGATTTIIVQLPSSPIEGKTIKIVVNKYGDQNQKLAVRSPDLSGNGSSVSIWIIGPGQTLDLCYSKQCISTGSAFGSAYSTGWISLNQGAPSSGNYSAVNFGHNNFATVNFASSIGGAANNASANYAATLGGDSCTASASRAAVVGGEICTASGERSFVGSGQSNTASGTYSAVVGGANNVAGNQGAAVVGGSFNTASGVQSGAFAGENHVVNAENAVAVGGARGTTRTIFGNFVTPASNAPIASQSGVSQSATLLLGRQTTDATATVLRSNSSAASTTNQVILPNNSAYTFQGTCIANVTGGGTTSGWKFEGVIKRGANAASTALVAAVTPLVIAQDAGAVTWVLAVTADTTNGGIKVEVTGAAATTIRWVAKIETTEVTF